MIGRKRRSNGGLEVPSFVSEQIPKLVSIIAAAEAARLRRMAYSGQLNPLLIDGAEARHALRITMGLAATMAGYATGVLKMPAPTEAVEVIKEASWEAASVVPVHIERHALDLWVVQLMTGAASYRFDRYYEYAPVDLWAVLAVAGGSARFAHLRLSQIRGVYAQVLKVAGEQAR